MNDCYEVTGIILHVSNKHIIRDEKQGLIKDDFIECFTICDRDESFGTEEEKNKRTMISAYINKKFDHHHERYLHTVCKLRKDLIDYIIDHNKSRDNT